jgi:pimeloyl-ACP methyl ester carboxylesterase
MLPQHWEAFARRGIASLSWDKPGLGDSTGDWTAQTMEDRAQEGLAAIKFLQERPEIIPNKIGVWGISQAGWVLPLMYTLSPEDVAFLVAVSVPVGTGDEQELFRITHQLPADGYPPTEVDKALAFSMLRLYLKNRQAPFDYIVQLQRLIEEEPWFPEVGAWDADAYYFLRQLPADIPIPKLLETITCPVLTVFGERDTIVDGKQSAQVYAASLKKAGNADVTIKIFPGADHALFPSETGGMKELQQSFLKPAGQKVFAPGYLDLIAEWVQQRFSREQE